VDDIREALSKFKKTGFFQKQGTLAQGGVYRQDYNGEHTIKEGRIVV
jgi:hypothetical protein